MARTLRFPKGTEVTAYIAGNTPLDPAKFSQQAVTSPGASPQPTADISQLSTVSIKSDPQGAEITIDGKFVGTTPSSVQLNPGEHTVSIEKAGLKLWQKALTVTAGGSVSLEATLEKLP